MLLHNLNLEQKTHFLRLLRSVALSDIPRLCRAAKNGACVVIREGF